MKNNNRQEESFILAIHSKRHNINEMVLVLPFILVILFAIIGAPIIIALCELSVLKGLLLILGPIICVLLFYIIRKRIIINNFIKVKDTSDRIELSVTQSDEFEAGVDGRVFMFGYSEYMEKVLYNWFSSLNVIGSDKLKMHKVIYNNGAPVYLAVCEAELNIPEESKDKFEAETATCLLLSDMENGKVVNVKLCARLSQK